MRKLCIPVLFIATTFITTASAQNNVRFEDIKPGMKDKWLEREALRLANEKAINYHWPEQYVKAVIISPKWELDLDKNGFAKGRKIHVELYCKMEDGHCGIGDFVFKQKIKDEAPDGVFSEKLLYDSNSDVYYAACE